MLAGATINMRDIIKSLPDSIIPLLSENNRLDMIDFMDSGMKAEVTNVLNGKCSMLTLSDQYTKIQLTESSVVELILLETQMPVDSVNQVLCVVKTFGTDIRESTVDFYSVKGRSLSIADYMVHLDADMWMATWNEHDAVLTVTPVDRLNPPANEEQKTTDEVLINLKWDGLILK
jgi:hypothetical protein